MGCVSNFNGFNRELDFKKIKTTEDYTVGGRKIGAILVALSHGAGAMSGFMFMGLPGYAYMLGLFAFWL